jgi:2-C-methyl-D-erythritol 4-phosphate cytidylyltransferase
MTGAIVVAAGRGERLGGDLPKGVRPLLGSPLILYSLLALEATPEVEATIAVVPRGYEQQMQEVFAEHRVQKVIAIREGGPSRLASVINGLANVRDAWDWVAVHDAARPLATPRLFSRVIETALIHGGAIAARPATDTLKEANGRRVAGTLDRERVWRAETPQVFPASALYRALEACRRAHLVVTDEAQAMERQHHPIELVQDPESNFKINTVADWQYAEFLLRQRSRH